MHELTEAGEAGTPDDPSITAEILLLLRLALADGTADARAAAAMRRVASRGLGLDGDGLDEVVSEIEHLVAAVGAAAAGAVLRGLAAERRGMLARRLARIAAGDDELAGHEARLCARIGAILGVGPIAFPRAGEQARPS